MHTNVISERNAIMPNGIMHQDSNPLRCMSGPFLGRGVCGSNTRDLVCPMQHSYLWGLSQQLLPPLLLSLFFTQMCACLCHSLGCYYCDCETIISVQDPEQTRKQAPARPLHT